MNFAEIAAETARLDAILAPIAKAPVDTSDPDWEDKMRASHPLDETGTRAAAEGVLLAIIARYADGDANARQTIRDLFDRYTSFRWAAHLPREWDTAEDFRARLIHLSARDQGSDTRDEIIGLQILLDMASLAGIEAAPILVEVAEMSSDVDRYGMGSVKDILLRCT